MAAMRRGVRFPQWRMLLVAILAILSNEVWLVGIVRFARRHRQVLNERLGTDFGKEPSDSTFRLLLSVAMYGLTPRSSQALTLPTDAIPGHAPDFCISHPCAQPQQKQRVIPALVALQVAQGGLDFINAQHIALNRTPLPLELVEKQVAIAT